MARWFSLACSALLAACGHEISYAVDLQHANARAVRQTPAAAILVFETDVDRPYDVLADLEVTVRQQGAFGDRPTRAVAVRALREQAGRIGAHAIVMLAFGKPGMSWWSNNELQGRARAVRFR